MTSRSPKRWLTGVLSALFAVVSAFAQQPGGAPANVAAKLLVMEGQVSVLRDNVPWALKVGDTVSPRQEIVTGPDGHALFEVNDGSTFQVFPNSRVIFRNTYNWQELIDVFIGRIKVHIQRWGGQPNPARIHTPTAVIAVRGTTFDIVVDGDESTLVSVEEGQVAVRHRLLLTENPRILNGGEQLRVYRNIPLAKSKLDKGRIYERGANAVIEAFYTIMLRGPRVAGGAPAPGGGVPLPGDTEAPAPPPPPPPPPPPNN
jgi:ferric-dicitrate binding protein FerR (iron transport regulator)